MRNKKGQFVKGIRYSPDTEFKKGHHWREKQPFWDRKWLTEEYVNKKRSAKDIALEFNVTENAILFWLKKHDVNTRSMSEIRKNKRWGLFGTDNPMWNKKGELNQNWKGGVSEERQAFYSSQEWKSVCSFVWKRDGATCQRCGLKKSDSYDMPFHIHHVKSFKYKKLRADPSNLVLLCESCHLFVHSKKNTKNEFL